MLLTVDLERLRLRSGERLLDAGCGEGRHCFGALERGARVVGLDLDRGPLAGAVGPLRNRAAELGSLGEMIQGSVFQLPFENETFDKVICSEVMEHVHDYCGAARELARVTKPGGLVAVTIPTATSEHLYLRAGDDYFESPGGHIRIFKPRQLSLGLASAGLDTIGVGFAHALHTPYWVLRSIAGLPNADQSRLVQFYRHFLIRATGSKVITRVESFLNYCFPKSLILYAEKRASTSART
ncbi:MAG: class I SAM-dependent methyltransferase [Deltaproteobacteria bacterium]|nr:class I SAM-dependent methyltransferase [Deltaproteobacteria bacterium]MBW2362122.1 class I SAM-dependent methyltransferase [Deltaproteobacteria bacterium]